MTNMKADTYIDLNCHLKFCSPELSSNTSKHCKCMLISLKGGSVCLACPFNLLLFVETNEACLNTRYFFHSKYMLAGEIP